MREMGASRADYDALVSSLAALRQRLRVVRELVTSQH